MTNDDKKYPKKPLNYCCIKCDFTSCNKKDYTRHLLTRKHQMMTNDDTEYPIEYMCSCGKKYKHRQGLSIHKKTCNIVKTPLDKNNEKTMNSNACEIEIDKEMLINMLLKNQEVMEKMMEIVPHIGMNNSHNTITTTNSHNSQNFNINMFLNDHCKNAMNLTDFIESLPITAQTYDDTIDHGLTKTITNMITHGLNQLDVLERPIHCTDATRKTLYVKEDNVWEKDNKLVRILSGIRSIAYKQRTLINKWKDVNGGWDKNDNIQTRFTSLICNSMNDIENDAKETNKIIRSISKMVYLDQGIKTQFLEC